MDDWLKWLKCLNSETREENLTAWNSAKAEVPSIVEVYKRQNVAQFV